MILTINTTENHNIEIAIWQNKKLLASEKFAAQFEQSEKLLPAIDKLLKKLKISLGDLKKIKVANTGGSFTALRIGVVTANALAFALNIPVGKMTENKTARKFTGAVMPEYNAEPNITAGKIKI